MCVFPDTKKTFFFDDYYSDENIHTLSGMFYVEKENAQVVFILFHSLPYRLLLSLFIDGVSSITKLYRDYL